MYVCNKKGKVIRHDFLRKKKDVEIIMRKLALLTYSVE